MGFWEAAHVIHPKQVSHQVVGIGGVRDPRSHGLLPLLTSWRNYFNTLWLCSLSP
jgi:hypothetical protein